MQNNNDIKDLEEEINQIDNLLNYCKENKYSNRIIFILTALRIKRKESLQKLL